MSDTSPKPFVFVLMPFDDTYDDIYKLGIKSACESCGAYAERVDEQAYDGRVLDRIYNQIAKADIVIADMTGRNPNVFYEVGYAHALDKRVILLTQIADDIPFDLKGHPHIVYGGKIAQLKEELIKRVLWAVEHPLGRLESLDNAIELYMQGIPLAQDPTFRYPKDGKYFVRLMLDAHNPLKKHVNRVSFRIGIISSDTFTHTWLDHTKRGVSAVQLPNGGRMHVFPIVHDLQPGEWESGIRCDLGDGDLDLPLGSKHHFIVRVFTGGIPSDFNLTCEITEGIKK